MTTLTSITQDKPTQPARQTTYPAYCYRRTLTIRNHLFTGSFRHARYAKHPQELGIARLHTRCRVAQPQGQMPRVFYPPDFQRSLRTALVRLARRLSPAQVSERKAPKRALLLITQIHFSVGLNMLSGRFHLVNRPAHYFLHCKNSAKPSTTSHSTTPRERAQQGNPPASKLPATFFKIF